jgi:hypothetical protein
VSSDSVDRLSEVLTNLQDLNEQSDLELRVTLNDQVDVLRQVQKQMQMQLRLHDAQIAALREIITLLSDRTRH